MLNKLSKKIKDYAKAAGADLVGIAPAFVDEAAINQLRKFIEERRQGGMKYLEDYESRVQPDRVLEGVKSVIVVGVNYFRKSDDPALGFGRVARYAYGRDYHKVVKNILKKTVDGLMEFEPLKHANFRVCVDSAPLLEKYYAVKAGIGFIGKNTTLISRELGSFIVLGEVLTDVELEYDQPVKGTCGTCTRCLEACPTRALVGPDMIDARRCISYLTIEHKGEIEGDLAAKMGDRLFGCDICQEVCPYNRVFARETKNPDFHKAIAGEALELKEILDMDTDEAFTARFAGSPVMRAKRAGLQRNARVVLRNENR